MLLHGTESIQIDQAIQHEVKLVQARRKSAGKFRNGLARQRSVQLDSPNNLPCIIYENVGMPDESKVYSLRRVNFRDAVRSYVTNHATEEASPRRFVRML